jgi:predicted nucleic acid-binding protein
MNSRYVIDSYAWIEYFRGSKAGETVRDIIEKADTATPTIVLAELSDKYLREKLDFQEDLFFIKSKSHILPLDEETALAAGEINVSMKKEVPGWGMADSIVLATVRAKNAKVVTDDQHFRTLKESIMIT